MDKKEFNKIRRQTAKMTDEQKEELVDYLVDESVNKEEMIFVESILDLIGASTEKVEKYGVYIDEYYKLPMKSRRIVCTKYSNCFLKNGNDIKSLCMLIAYEAEHVEEKVDPVVDAIREANVLIKTNPKIDTTGIRYE